MKYHISSMAETSCVCSWFLFWEDYIQRDRYIDHQKQKTWDGKKVQVTQQVRGRDITGKTGGRKNLFSDGYALYSTHTNRRRLTSQETIPMAGNKKKKRRVRIRKTRSNGHRSKKDYRRQRQRQWGAVLPLLCFLVFTKKVPVFSENTSTFLWGFR